MFKEKYINYIKNLNTLDDINNAMQNISKEFPTDQVDKFFELNKDLMDVYCDEIIPVLEKMGAVHEPTEEALPIVKEKFLAVLEKCQDV